MWKGRFRVVKTRLKKRRIDSLLNSSPRPWKTDMMYATLTRDHQIPEIVSEPAESSSGRRRHRIPLGLLSSRLEDEGRLHRREPCEKSAGVSTPRRVI